MEDTSKVLKLLHTSSEIIGAVSATAIGLIGGTPAAISGAIIGTFVSKGLIEISNRFLSHREEVRIGAAASLVIVGVQNRIDNGDFLRQDDFFNEDEKYRSKSDELFEGILIKCKNEYEEKKIEYISNIYINAAFDPTIKQEYANQILNLAEQLTYRQIKVLAFIGQNENNLFNIRESNYNQVSFPLTTDLRFLLQDYVNLVIPGLIRRDKNKNGTVLVANISGFAPTNISGIAPSEMFLTPIGIDYFRLMKLSEMPTEEFDFIHLLK